jgi:multidrug efflux pump subunit AcrA (membrane-fusion protein)
VRFPLKAICQQTLAASIFVLSACSQQTAAQAESTAIKVVTAKPVVQSLEQTAAFPGRISPDESVQVIGKVAGTVFATYFEVGDTVKKGDLLYEIDRPTSISRSTKPRRPSILPKRRSTL